MLNPPVISEDVFQWPECQALMKRLGVPVNARTTYLQITMNLDSIVEIKHHFQGENTASKVTEEVQPDAIV